jgi:hypothetical protein
VLKRITRALLAITLLPLLISAGRPASPLAPRVQACHYEAEISGTYTRRDGSTFEAPIGSITVTACSSPADLAQRVEELTNNVRRQATAQAVQKQPPPR